MSHKSEAHEALGLLFALEGTPLKMIVDGAKMIKLGEFVWKCQEQEASCYLQGTKAYSPWSTSILSMRLGNSRRAQSGD
jgi:hypothetical protein